MHDLMNFYSRDGNYINIELDEIAVDTIQTET